MKTVGEYIKTNRLKKRISVRSLSDNLKIKEDFVSAIEANEWAKLPAYPVVLGFVKRISKYLSIKEEHAVALLRRDYPPKTLDVSPRNDWRRGIVFGPRFAFGLAVGLVVVAILIYLGVQYKNYLTPPKLVVTVSEDVVDVVEGEEIEVSGYTDSSASITVNNQPVSVGEDGEFRVVIEIGENTEQVLVRSTSRSGKISEVVRQIQ